MTIFLRSKVINRFDRPVNAGFEFLFNAVTVTLILVAVCLSPFGRTTVRGSNFTARVDRSSVAPALLELASTTLATSQTLPDVPELLEVDDGFLASVFSGTGVLVVVALGLIGLLLSYKLNPRAYQSQATKTDSEGSEIVDEEPHTKWESTVESWEQDQAQESAEEKSDRMSNESVQRIGIARVSVSPVPPLFGAYRIDQEVGKLILGQAHRMDVLSSRSPDDRRAIETSLMKCLSSELEVAAHGHARQALEQYGFVARQCAVLLLAPDPFERTSAARALGEIKSLSALPFLLEALYDSESIVRNQAVISIGELRLPSAIGALLDMARRHPDVPSILISRALSACSVESRDEMGEDTKAALLDDLNKLEQMNPNAPTVNSSDETELLPDLASAAEIAQEIDALAADPNLDVEQELEVETL